MDIIATPRFTTPELAAVLAAEFMVFDAVDPAEDCDRYTGDEDVALVYEGGIVNVFSDGFFNGETSDPARLAELLRDAWSPKARGWVG
jgi:hypothetical protein